MSAAAPSIAGDVARGVRVTRRAYGMTEKDVQDTVRDMAAKILEGGRTPSVRSLAGNILKQAGFPQGVRAQTQTILDFVRKQVGYVGDPERVEFVQGATVTLCIEGASICIPVGDCDDLIVALGSLLMSIGLSVFLLIQDYGEQQQMHVLLAVKDENESMLAADPSKRHAPVGAKDRAIREAYVDPLQPRLDLPQVPGEFVSVGQPKKKPCCSACAKGERCTGCGMLSHPCACEGGRSLGRRPMFNRLGAVSTAFDFTAAQIDINAMALKIRDGDGYAKGPTPSLGSALAAYQDAGNLGATRIGPEIDGAGAPNITADYTQRAWRLNQMLAATDAASADATTIDDAGVLAKSMLNLYQTAIAKAQSPAAPKSGNSSGVGTVLTLSAIGGLLFVGWRYSASRSRRRA